MKLCSWIFGIAVLAQVTFPAAPTAFAQSRNSDQLSLPGQAIQWSRDRLSEFDAAVGNLERDLATRQADVRARGEAALKEVRAQRDACRVKVDQAASNAKTWTEAQASDAKKSLDQASSAFQAKVGEYLDAVKADAAARRAVLEAEYDAGQKAWQRSVDELRSEVRRLDAKQRAAMDASIDALKGQMEEAKARIERLNDVSREAWAAATRDYADAKQRVSDMLTSIRKSISDAAKS